MTYLHRLPNPQRFAPHRDRRVGHLIGGGSGCLVRPCSGARGNSSRPLSEGVTQSMGSLGSRTTPRRGNCASTPTRTGGCSRSSCCSSVAVSSSSSTPWKPNPSISISCLEGGNHDSYTADLPGARCHREPGRPSCPRSRGGMQPGGAPPLWLAQADRFRHQRGHLRPSPRLAQEQLTSLCHCARRSPGR